MLPCNALKCARRGFTPDDFRTAAEEVAGVDLAAWFHKSLASAEELDFAEALDWFGLRFAAPPDPQAAKTWKLEIREDADESQTSRFREWFRQSDGKSLGRWWPRSASAVGQAGSLMLEDSETAPVSLSRAELLEKRFRVENIRLGLLQPAANDLRVDLGGVTEHRLRRPVFAHRFKASLVERLPNPEQEVDGFDSRVVTDDGIVINELHRATVPYFGGRLGKGRVNQLAQEIADRPKHERLSLRVPSASIADRWRVNGRSVYSKIDDDLMTRPDKIRIEEES